MIRIMCLRSISRRRMLPIRQPYALRGHETLAARPLVGEGRQDEHGRVPGGSRTVAGSQARGVRRLAAVKLEIEGLSSQVSAKKSESTMASSGDHSSEEAGLSNALLFMASQ